MPSSTIRIGAVMVYWKPQDYDNFIELSPTTGPVKFIESWSKTHLTTITLKFTLLNSITETVIKKLPRKDEKIDLMVIYPPDVYGKCEEKIIKNCIVSKIKHSVSTNEPEKVKFSIKFFEHEFKDKH